MLPGRFLGVKKGVSVTFLAHRGVVSAAIHASVKCVIAVTWAAIRARDIRGGGRVGRDSRPRPLHDEGCPGADSGPRLTEIVF